MSILLSRSKHEEFESNSALQIRNQKERIAEKARKMKPMKKNFTGCKISHLANHLIRYSDRCARINKIYNLNSS